MRSNSSIESTIVSMECETSTGKNKWSQIQLMELPSTNTANFRHRFMSHREWNPIFGPHAVLILSTPQQCVRHNGHNSSIDNVCVCVIDMVRAHIPYSHNIRKNGKNLGNCIIKKYESINWYFSITLIVNDFEKLSLSLCPRMPTTTMRTQRTENQ